MAVSTDRPAPYAPPSAVLEIITRYRDRGLQTPINADVLARVGITPSLTPRTLQTLETLDLIDDQGMPTPTFESLRLAQQGEYQQRLADWLNHAYVDVLAIIDPATATETQVRDAFRTYNPLGQQDRMVTLFSGLYAAAGVRQPKEPVQREPRAAPASRGRVVTPPPSKTKSWAPTAREKLHAQAGMPSALAGLMASLPQGGAGWTADSRKKFLATFETVLDFCIPVVTENGQAGSP